MTTNLESARVMLAEAKMSIAELDGALEALASAEGAGDPVLTTRQTARLLVRVEALADRVRKLAEKTAAHLELLPDVWPQRHQHDGAAEVDER